MGILPGAQESERCYTQPLGVAQGPLLPTSYSPGYHQLLYTWYSGPIQTLPSLQREKFLEKVAPFCR